MNAVGKEKKVKEDNNSKGNNKGNSKSDSEGNLGTWFKDLAEVLIILVVVLVILRVALGPPMPPMVVVTSTSMLHEDDLWKSWFEKQNFEENAYSKFPMIDGFDRGDLIVTKQSAPELGDVVIYERDLISSARAKDPIIHRLVGIIEVKEWKVSNITGTTDCLTGKNLEDTVEYVNTCKSRENCAYKSLPGDEGNFKIYMTKGDNNNIQGFPGNTDQCSGIALPVLDSQITTKAWVKIPKLGYPKLWLNDALNLITPK